MPSTSSTKTVASDLMHIFDSQDDFVMDVTELSLEQKIKFEISQYNAMRIEQPEK